MPGNRVATSQLYNKMILEDPGEPRVITSIL